MNAAREKLENEGECRACGCYTGLEAAHVWPRARGAKGFDNPDEIVPLCNALQGAGCHEAYDAHELDLLPLVTLEEELAAVRNAKRESPRGSGIAGAYRRLSGSRDSDWAAA